MVALDRDGISRWAAKALDSEISDLLDASEGGRNDQLNRAAFNLGQIVAGGALDRESVTEQLRAAALSIGLTESETDKTLLSGMTSGMAQPRTAPTETPWPAQVHETSPEDLNGAQTSPRAPEGADAASETAEEAEDGPRLNPILDWHALWEAEDDEEWIVFPLLPARRMVALYSEPKAGKSLLMLEIAVGIARGTAPLGQQVDRARRVLYVDFENDPRGDIRARLQAMGLGPDDLENLCYLSFPALAWLDSPLGAVDLLRHVEAYECEVVVIDTVGRAVAGEENENDTWLRFYRHTGVALKRAGVACIRLDHQGKDADKGMRGGSAKVGDVDAVWRLSRLSEDTVQLECTAHRMPLPEQLLTLTRARDPLHHIVAGNPYAAAGDALLAAAVRFLDQHDVPRDLSQRATWKLVKNMNGRPTTRLVERAQALRSNIRDLDAEDWSE